MLSPLPILLYLILLSLLVCIITVLYRLHTEKRIIINNSITSLQPATSEKNKAEIMREIYKNKQDHLEVNRYEAIKEYTYTVFSPYMTDDCLETLCQNIKLYEIPESCINSVLTNGNTFLSKNSRSLSVKSCSCFLISIFNIPLSTAFMKYETTLV